MVTIVNPGPQDYHMHSLVFSDGFNTIDEIVQFAGKIGLTEIAITDHSQAALDYTKRAHTTYRQILTSWKNMHNDVNVIFGVEGDLLDDQGRICSDIRGVKSDFLILSAHPHIYQSPKENITKAYINAIKRHGHRIKFIGHPNAHYYSQDVDMEELIRAANDANIPLELDAAYLDLGRLDLPQLDMMIDKCNRMYVNSDAHTLYQMTLRAKALDFLRQKGVEIKPQFGQVVKQENFVMSNAK